MLAIALELAREDPSTRTSRPSSSSTSCTSPAALNDVGGTGIPLWDDEDEFFYDVLHLDTGEFMPLKVRSLVGLIPLLAVETIEPDLLEPLPDFTRRMDWFLHNRPDLAALVSRWEEPGIGERRLLALVRGHRMKRCCARMLDPDEFLSDYGIRSLSRDPPRAPVSCWSSAASVHGSTTSRPSRGPALFGGNSNWRGPVWFPINYLLIEALQKFHHYYGDDFRCRAADRLGDRLVTLGEVADDLGRRLERSSCATTGGRRPFRGPDAPSRAGRLRGATTVLFHEYFDGDTGAGLGASHQTGWTALVAKLLDQRARRRRGVSGAGTVATAGGGVLDRSP